MEKEIVINLIENIVDYSLKMPLILFSVRLKDTKYNIIQYKINKYIVVINFIELILIIAGYKSFRIF